MVGGQEVLGSVVVWRWGVGVGGHSMEDIVVEQVIRRLNYFIKG